MGRCETDGDCQGRDDGGQEVDGRVDKFLCHLLVREMGLGDCPHGEVFENMSELAFHLGFMQEGVFAVLAYCFLLGEL